MDSLKIDSFNVKGLADEKTRKEVFNWLRDKEMNAYMLQEAHFTKENENIIEAEWGFKCIFSICSSQSCGVINGLSLKLPISSINDSSNNVLSVFSS
jgi:exonuclease III